MRHPRCILFVAISDVDPFKVVSKDLLPFTETIKDLVEAEHPVLSMAAKHFFEKRHGKRFRPTIVGLMGEKDFFFEHIRKFLAKSVVCASLMMSIHHRRVACHREPSMVEPIYPVRLPHLQLLD